MDASNQLAQEKRLRKARSVDQRIILEHNEAAERLNEDQNEDNERLNLE